MENYTSNHQNVNAVIVNLVNTCCNLLDSWYSNTWDKPHIEIDKSITFVKLIAKLIYDYDYIC